MPANAYADLLHLLPSAPLQVATVTAVDGELASLTLLGGGVITARGTAAVGARVFVRNGLIEGPAPSLPLVDIEI